MTQANRAQRGAVRSPKRVWILASRASGSQIPSRPQPAGTQATASRMEEDLERELIDRCPEGEDLS